MPNELLCLKGRIDEIDERILNLLLSRFRLVECIATYKSLNAIPAKSPARIKALIENRQKSGAARGLPELAARNIWTAIIEEACRLEEELIAIGTTAPHQERHLTATSGNQYK